MLLECSEKISSWTSGCHNDDSRARAGRKWAGYEARDPKFLEDYLFSDLGVQKPRAISMVVPEDALLELSEKFGMGEASRSLSLLPLGGKAKKPARGTWGGGKKGKG